MKRFSDAELDQLNERVCNTVGDGYSLREDTISELLDAIKGLKAERSVNHERLQYLLDYADQSDECCYGTLSTSTVRLMLEQAMNPDLQP